MRKTIALLSMDNDADDIQANGVAEVLDSVSPDAELGELNALATEMDDIEAGVTQGAANADALDAAADKIEESVEEGGLPAVAAEAMNLLLSRIQQGMGMPAHKTGLAIEGFASKQTRVRSTQLAVESLRGTAKTVWESIVKTFNRVIEWVKGFFSKLMDANLKLRDAATAVKAEAKAKTEENKGTIKIPKSLIKKGGKTDGFGVVKLLEGLGQASDAGDSTSVADLADNLVKAAKMPVANGGGEAGATKALKATLTKQAEYYNAKFAGTKTFKVEGDGADISLVSTDNFAEEDQETKAVPKNQVQLICDAIVNIADLATAKDKARKEIEESIKKSMGYMETAMGGDENQIKAVRMGSLSTVKFINTECKVIAESANAARAALKVCTQSLGAKEAAK